MSTFRRFRVVVMAVMVVMVAVPATLYASHRFDDVPSGKFYHQAVTALDRTGITNGCSPTEFCPERDLSRGEMAEFLHRGLGRVAFGSSVANLDDGYGEPASVRIRTGGVSGGSVRVSLDGAVTVYADGNVNSCPCEVEAFIYRTSDAAQMPYSVFAQLPGEKTPGGFAQVSLPVRWVATQGSATARTYKVAVFVNDGSPTGVRAEAGLAAETLPFGG